MIPRTRCGLAMFRECVGYCTEKISSKAERGCLQELCKTSNTAWK